ncbi:CO/xanthine dehydrogenase Mo-binding subunit [Sinorhizobium fredii]|uniref:molybdopterin cofactor-binding domain-containing protein n=1 Tax=Rhizobium fredii TaxID=380 RepID=UPI00210E5B7C|nr:molybdopterin cofactor-binding domain-containing protein [Sinorhizobium fredii]UTY47850.1 xanthine dehydrogenase family protein molybdopterin-binding subunit [Sinorhizobium fredii]
MATTPIAEMKVSRRSFLRGGAMLTLLVTAGGVINVVRGDAIGQQTPEIPVNAWVRISATGEIVIGFGSTEMGQGVMTSLPIILAEEMDADWSKVRVEQINADPNKLYGNPKTGGILFTAGSSSVEGYFEIMRRAGANARRILVYSAAKEWDVDPAEITTELGYVVHAASERRLSFGEVAMLPEIISGVPEVQDTELKPPSAYRLIGSGIERLDIPDKTRGAAIYSIDVKVEGMVYASTLEAPVEGEKPVTIDDKAAKALPGVIAVLPVGDAVAIIAKRWDIAIKARDLLVVEWSGDSPFRTANSETDRADVIEKSSDLKISGTAWAERGDAAGVLAAAGSKVIEADYYEAMHR